MIRHITPTELNEIKEKYDHKIHAHKYENIFLFSPPGLLNSKAYKLCELCGEMISLLRNAKIDKEITDIISKKLESLNK